MARNHARIYATIWSDPDFLAVSSDAQRLYLLLLSQPNLSHCGLLALTVKRWASKALDTTPARIEAALQELADARFVVVDHGTEELLIRSFIRGDEVYKQPNVLAAAGKDAEGIVSPLLRSELLVEIERISHLEGLTARVTQILTTLAGTLRGTLPDTPSEALARGNPRATGMGSVTEVSTDSPSPSPSPSPVPALRAEPQDDPTSDLLIEHVRAYADPPPPDAQLEVKQQIMRLVAQRIDPERIRAGLARLRERRMHPKTLPHLVAECSAVERPSTTDRAVAKGLSLVEKYRAQEAT